MTGRPPCAPDTSTCASSSPASTARLATWRTHAQHSLTQFCSHGTDTRHCRPVRGAQSELELQAPSICLARSPTSCCPIQTNTAGSLPTRRLLRFLPYLWLAKGHGTGLVCRHPVLPCTQAVHRVLEQWQDRQQHRGRVRTTFHCRSMRLVAESAVSGSEIAAMMPPATMLRNHLPAACAACSGSTPAVLQLSGRGLWVTRQLCTSQNRATGMLGSSSNTNTLHGRNNVMKQLGKTIMPYTTEISANFF